MHKYKYLKNLTSSKVYTCNSLKDLKVTPKKFDDKKLRSLWSNHPETDYAYYSLAEGTIASLRITGDNKVTAMYGFVVEYDNIKIDCWKTTVKQILAKCGANKPTLITRTPSGGVRLVFEFEEQLLIDAQLYSAFIKKLVARFKLKRLLAGFDDSCTRATQYYYLGDILEDTGKKIPKALYTNLLLKTSLENPPQAPSALSIPLEVIEEEVRSNPKYKNRWTSTFEVGSRGPLYWIDDGRETEGCMVVEDGMICYSDRAPKSFLSWKEIFGQAFVEKYENRKLDNLLKQYWFSGKAFYGLINDVPVMIDKDQLKLELRQAGYNPVKRPRERLSELESSILLIQQQCRITEIAPVIFDSRIVVESGANKILNTSTLKAVQPAGEGDKKHWPFIDKWLSQFFKDETSLLYFYAWLQRIYSAVLYKEMKQGHALLLVGPTNKGKSLLSNKLIGGLLGGFADASDYLSGDSKFNKELGRVAAWVIDDTTSAASFAEQRRATELIKKATANPRIEYQAKFEDTITISWAGRVIMSLNMDPNSLSVIPALDSSNRDKILALRISDAATSDFASLLGIDTASNSIIEKTIKEELPYFGKWLEDFEVPKSIKGDSRFGVKSYIDPEIDAAAFANSTRSLLIETIEFFVKKLKEYGHDKPYWRGNLTDFVHDILEYNNNKPLNSMVANTEWLRRSIQSLEEACISDDNLRAVTSTYKNNMKFLCIDLDPKWDISISHD